MKKLLTLFLAVLFFSCTGKISTFELDPAELDRSELPIRIETKKKLDPAKSYYLKNAKNDEVHPAQALSENILVGFFREFPKGSKVVLDLIQGDSEESPFPLTHVNEEEGGIQMLVNGNPVLFYQTATAFPGDSLPEYYKRSGFIHPLQSPNGEILTDPFPVGHVHQHALFNAWVNTSFNGKKVDFWNQQEELGTVQHSEVIRFGAGPLLGHLKSRLGHISLLDGEVLEEIWELYVYPVSNYYLLDLLSEQTNVTTDTLFINQYHYGGMAFRGSKEWNRVDSLHFTNRWKILTSEGLTNENSNHTKAKWVDASGVINGKEVGVTVFGFPDNFRYPQSIRVHPEMPYWVFSPMVDGPFYIAPGEKYRSSFRYYVHNGLPDNSTIQKIQRDLESPVKVLELD